MFTVIITQSRVRHIHGIPIGGGGTRRGGIQNVDQTVDQIVPVAGT